MQQGLDETGKTFFDKVLGVYEDTSCPLPVGADKLKALVAGFRSDYSEKLQNELKNAMNSAVISTVQVLRLAVEEVDRAAKARAQQERVLAAIGSHSQSRSTSGFPQSI